MKKEGPIFQLLAAEGTLLEPPFLNQYKKIAVACSGGLDSTVLLDVLCKFSKQKKYLPLSIVHVNFGLRGKESWEDEEFVRQLAQDQGVPFLGFRVTDEQREAARGKNVQVWARNVRLEIFRRLQREEGYLIALAHHQRDVAENVLFRLSRGAPLERLVGMKVYRPPLWRPFLNIPFECVSEWASRHNLPHRVDSSNAKMIYSRNVIRHQILPLLEGLSKGATRRIAVAGNDIEEGVNTLFVPFMNPHEPLKIAVVLSKKTRIERLKIIAQWAFGEYSPEMATSVKRKRLEDMLTLCTMNDPGYLSPTVSLAPLRRIVYRRGGFLKKEDGVSIKNKRLMQHRRSFEIPNAKAFLGAGASLVMTRPHGEAIRLSNFECTSREFPINLSGSIAVKSIDPFEEGLSRRDITNHCIDESVPQLEEGTSFHAVSQTEAFRR